MWGEGGGLPPGSAIPDSCLSGSRDSEGMEASWKRAASPPFGCTAAGSGYQQSEHAAFLKHNTDPFPSIRWLRQCTCFYFFQQNKSLRCSTACIDLLSKPLTDPTCAQKHLFPLLHFLKVQCQMRKKEKNKMMVN